MRHALAVGVAGLGGPGCVWRRIRRHRRGPDDGRTHRRRSAADLVVETIDTPYPVFMYTRDPDEVFLLGGTPLAIESYVENIDGLLAGENEAAPYSARYEPSSGDITCIDLDRGASLPDVGGAVVHADGFISVVSQAHLDKIEPESMSIDLPGGPTSVYNGLLTGRTGALIPKSWPLGEADTSLLLVDGTTMEVTFSTACDCATARQLLYATDSGDGSNNLVVLDLVTGDELLRVETPATLATIGQVLPTADGDVYISSNESGQPAGFLVRVHVP